MIRSRVSSRVNRLRAEWVVLIKVMKYLIRHMFALSIGWSAVGLKKAGLGIPHGAQSGDPGSGPPAKAFSLIQPLFR
jgi:hypothetical protein